MIEGLHTIKQNKLDMPFIRTGQDITGVTLPFITYQLFTTQQSPSYQEQNEDWYTKTDEYQYDLFTEVNDFINRNKFESMLRDNYFWQTQDVVRRIGSSSYDLFNLDEARQRDMHIFLITYSYKELKALDQISNPGRIERVLFEEEE